jgi:alpha-tubulin suppressor-like RCC1 family protein
MSALRTLTIALLLTFAWGSAQAGADVIAAGETSSCSVAPSGAASCWGARTEGSLGDGSVSAWTFDPVQPTGLGAGVTAVSLTTKGGGSGNHACAIVGGAAKCWGPNGSGQLGDGTTTQRNVPTQVVGLESGVTQIDTHSARTCAIHNGEAVCWGSVSRAFTGEPTSATLLVPHAVAGGVGATYVSPGWRHECLVIAGGSVRCYGDNTNYQLGNGPGTPTLPGPVTKLVSGADHNCVLIGDGMRCWGTGPQLGVGTTDASATPVTPVGMGSGVVDFDVNWNHVCAIKVDGKAWCWGDASNGRVGGGGAITPGGGDVALTPVQVVGISNVTDIAVGRSHTCAIVGTSERWCWGSNQYGSLGNEAAGGQTSVPVPVIGSAPKPPAPPVVVVKPPVVVVPRPTTPVVPKAVAPSITWSSKVRRLSRTRTVTVATLSCPATAPAACRVVAPTTATFRIGRKSYALAVTAPRSVRAGRRGSVSVKLSRKAAGRLSGRTATVRIAVVLGATRKTTAQRITGRQS